MIRGMKDQHGMNNERAGNERTGRTREKNKEETGDNVEPRYPGAPTVEAGQLSQRRPPFIDMKERRREETTPAISDATRKRTWRRRLINY